MVLPPKCPSLFKVVPGQISSDASPNILALVTDPQIRWKLCLEK